MPPTIAVADPREVSTLVQPLRFLVVDIHICGVFLGHDGSNLARFNIGIHNSVGILQSVQPLHEQLTAIG